MNEVVVEKTIVLEMAHRLPNHNGKCKSIHGHSWQLTVRVAGPIKECSNNPDEGMVVDFSKLKDALTNIEVMFDHTLTLARFDPLLNKIESPDDVINKYHHLITRVTSYGPVNLVPFAPTSENLAVLWGEMLQRYLPDYKVVQVSVKETATSQAIWNC
jgi:6-pyruvoyl tetrahydropterin synthase/QueD family protein